jgi:hypothetical protein
MSNINNQFEADAGIEHTRRVFNKEEIESAAKGALRDSFKFGGTEVNLVEQKTREETSDESTPIITSVNYHMAEAAQRKLREQYPLKAENAVFSVSFTLEGEHEDGSFSDKSCIILEVEGDFKDDRYGNHFAEILAEHEKGAWVTKS